MRGYAWGRGAVIELDRDRSPMMISWCTRWFHMGGKVGGKRGDIPPPLALTSLASRIAVASNEGVGVRFMDMVAIVLGGWH